MIPIVELSTSTLRDVPSPPAIPPPAIEEEISTGVIPADDTLTPPEPTVNVDPSASTVTRIPEVDPLYEKSAIPLPSSKTLANEEAATFVSPEPLP